jgi:hypothetical protein
VLLERLKLPGWEYSRRNKFGWCGSSYSVDMLSRDS